MLIKVNVVQPTHDNAFPIPIVNVLLNWAQQA